MDQVIAEVEEAILSSLQRGDDGAAVLAFLEGYEKHVLATLSGMLHDEQAVLDVYSDFCENLCRDIRTYRGDAPVLYWGRRVARNSALRHQDKARRNSRREIGFTDEVLAASFADSTAARQPDAGLLWLDTNPYQQTPLKKRVALLVEQTDPEERQLLELRLVQERSWPEVTRLLLGELAPEEAKRKEDALRRRWSRLVLKLAAALAEDGAQRVERLLDSLQEPRRSLVEQWILKRRPWQEVCAEIQQTHSEQTADKLLRERREAIEQIEREYPRLGLLPDELRRNGLLSSPRCPRTIPARDRRKRS